MRFYFEDPAEGNVATKCLRVCSNSVTREIIDMLSEKFRPDMKMLTTSYALYEIHNNRGKQLTQEKTGEDTACFWLLICCLFAFIVACVGNTEMSVLSLC